MKKIPRQIRFLAPAFAVLFVGLAILAGFFFAGESSKAQILLEYETDRTAGDLLDAFRASGVIDRTGLDPRIKGFGVYDPAGALQTGFGSAPASLTADEARQTFHYDEARGLLVRVRQIGMVGAAPQAMMGGGMGRRGMIGAGAAGALFLQLDVNDWYRTRRLYNAATVLSPLVIAGIAVAFLLLLASNLRYRQKAEERETLARLGESARTLAHEIRNPLAGIRMQTGLLRRNTPGKASRELDIIDEEIERLNLLSRRVADFLKSPGGAPQRIVLPQFLRDLAQRSPFPVRLDEELSPAVVRFDPELLRSVMENLVRNAHESYDERVAAGGKEPQSAGAAPGAVAAGVEVGLRRDGTRAVVVVRDRGRGIAPGMADSVFDPSFTDKLHGTGVGLALSRQFVQAAGGTLTLAPREGGGTEARVTLPAEQTE